MSADQLEVRLTAIETTLAQVLAQVNQLVAGPDPKSRWWERPTSVAPEEVGRMLDEMAPYTQYIRQTGDVPPPNWKPGDPIPEPDHWK